MDRVKQLNFFRHTEAGRQLQGGMTLQEAIALTLQSLQAHGSQFSNWVVGYSGGKDSSATVTLIDHFIRSGQLQRPDHLIVIFSDTLMELPSLEDSVTALLAKLQTNGWRVIRTEPQLETAPTKTERFFVTLLGRGYPPPSSRFRWCTQRLKTNKLDAVSRLVLEEYGQDCLGIDGIRKGESVSRDQLILASCNAGDGECGQGWFHKNGVGLQKLSPILHWRVCQVWDWLAEACFMYDYPLQGVFDTYGVQDVDDHDLAGRTGCIGCPLVTTPNERRPKPDKALEAILTNERWSHMAPYQRLSEIYWALRWPENAHHIIGDIKVRHIKKATAKKPAQKGCLTLEARLWALEEILSIQRESIRLALELGRKPHILISLEEEALIRQMICDRVFPDPSKYDALELFPAG